MLASIYYKITQTYFFFITAKSLISTEEIKEGSKTFSINRNLVSKTNKKIKLFKTKLF